MADEPEVYRVDSFTDVDLNNLAEIARKEDYSRLAQWIMGHKDRELAARSHRHLERRKREYSELLGQLMQTQLDTIGPDDDLVDVLDKMDTLKKFSMPVVANQRFVGMISKATLLDKYRRELMVQTSTT